MCSESDSPLVTSPRISFSHDLRNGDDIGTVPIEDQAETEDSNPDQFDFSFGDDGLVNESCSADELFSDGLIRPLQLQEKFVVSKHSTRDGFVNERSSADGLFSDALLQEKCIVSKHRTLSPPPNPAKTECSEQDSSSSKEIIVSSVIESEQKHQSKSFWRINRSSSVHCDNSYKKSSFWSLPLMSRSNSTGSVPSPRQILKENKKQNSQKQVKNSSSSSSSFYVYQLSQKPPLKKNYGGSYGNGVWINPALNVPPPYIAKGTANLFGLTSLFRDKKDKKNKK